MMRTFSDMNDARDYVVRAIGEYAEFFDVDAIADEITEWRDGRLTMLDGFWDVVARHDLTEQVGSGVRDPGFRLVP